MSKAVLAGSRMILRELRRLAELVWPSSSSGSSKTMTSSLSSLGSPSEIGDKAGEETGDMSAIRVLIFLNYLEKNHFSAFSILSDHPTDRVKRRGPADLFFLGPGRPWRMDSLSLAGQRLLDIEHYRAHQRWRLKNFQGPPLRGCHIRVYRNKQRPYQPRQVPLPLELSLPASTYEGKQNQALRVAEAQATAPPRRTYGQTITDIFRFSQTAFPLVLLECLGPYWVIPSNVPNRIHIYLTRQQLNQIESSHWVLVKFLNTTRHKWRALLRRALNKK